MDGIQVNEWDAGLVASWAPLQPHRAKPSNGQARWHRIGGQSLINEEVKLTSYPGRFLACEYQTGTMGPGHRGVEVCILRGHLV
jgi:hypothetical protein